MRALTDREQALYDVRVGVVAAWAERTESKIHVQRLFGRAPIDDRAKLALKRQDLFYRAVLVEPPGQRVHQLLNDTVWGYFRNEMRIGPALFYEKATSQWETLYSGVLPTDWRRAVENPTTKAIQPEIVSDTLVPGDYRSLDAKVVMEFLEASGGRVMPLSTIPDLYPQLNFRDFSMEMRAGQNTRQTIELEPIGGKPPLTYELVTNPDGANLRLAGDRLILIGTGSTAGTYQAVVRATDSLSATDTATVNITITPSE